MLRRTYAMFCLVLLLTLCACQPVVDPATLDGPPTADTQASSAGEETDAVQEFLPASNPPWSLINSDWRTDFERRTVPWEEIRSGGPPKDGIPAIDDPAYESVEDAGQWLTERDPILVFEHNGAVRGYPLAILIWHEIVNDTVGGLPVAVTFCPLCNASIVFGRDFEGEVLDFGTTGLLRKSDLIMYDRQSESWWQQATGEAIVGQHAGKQLTFYATQILSFADYRVAFPDQDMLARPAVSRNYGANPYAGYDSRTGRPFLYDGELDERLGATERVVGIQIDETYRAYPFSVMRERGLVNDTIAGIPVLILHKSGTASALDTARISEGRDVGSSVVYDRTLGNRVLTFTANGNGEFRDEETGSTWNFLGQAIDGELAGEQLTRRVAFDHFWFAWSAFFPQTELYTGE